MRRTMTGEKVVGSPIACRTGYPAPMQTPARLEALMAMLARKQKEFGDTTALTVQNPKPAAWSPEEAIKAAAKKGNNPATQP